MGALRGPRHAECAVLGAGNTWPSALMLPILIIETRSDSGDTIEVKAASNLDQTPEDESFAIDNVKVWIR
jgi:hypothetical protein